MLRLKELRERKKISQQKLAIDLSISQSSISKYEIGLAEPDINTIIMLSDYFKVNTDYLLGRSDLKTFITKSDLSDDELEFLIDYMKLSSIQKLKICAYLKGISDSE